MTKETNKRNQKRAEADKRQNHPGRVIITADELKEIKAQIVEMDARLTRLMAQPLVYATVVKVDDGNNVVIAHEGKLFNVRGLPGKEFHPSSTVKVDMETKQIHC